MRHGTPSRRQRGRNNNGNNNGGRRNNQPRTQVFDSNGPDVRIRGTAHQVAEKYLSLAKDATSIGDIMIAESYYQHAEHYIRIINDNNGKFDNAKDSSANSSQNTNPNVSGDTENKNTEQPQKAKPKEVEDLSLPESILGLEPAAKKEKAEELEEA